MLKTIIFGAVLAIASQGASATFIYIYTGGGFTDTVRDNDPPSGAFTSADSVSGFFEIAAPLDADLANANIAGLVLDYEFSNGRSILDSLSTNAAAFGVWTDAIGGITGWTVQLISFFPSPASVGDLQASIASLNTPNTSFDSSQIEECLAVMSTLCDSSGLDAARNSDNPGTWSVLDTEANAIPEPSILSLLYLGLVGSIGVQRKRRSFVQ